MSNGVKPQCNRLAAPERVDARPARWFNGESTPRRPAPPDRSRRSQRRGSTEPMRSGATLPDGARGRAARAAPGGVGGCCAGLLGERDDARAGLGRLVPTWRSSTRASPRDTERLASTSNVKERGARTRAGIARAARATSKTQLVIMERLETADAAVAAQEAVIADDAAGAQASAEGKAAVASATTTWRPPPQPEAVAARLPPICWPRTTGSPPQHRRRPAAPPRVRSVPASYWHRPAGASPVAADDVVICPVPARSSCAPTNPACRPIADVTAADAGGGFRWRVVGGEEGDAVIVVELMADDRSRPRAGRRSGQRRRGVRVACVRALGVERRGALVPRGCSPPGWSSRGAATSGCATRSCARAPSSPAARADRSADAPGDASRDERWDAAQVDAWSAVARRGSPPLRPRRRPGGTGRRADGIDDVLAEFRRRAGRPPRGGHDPGRLRLLLAASRRARCSPPMPAAGTPSEPRRARRRPRGHAGARPTGGAAPRGCGGRAGGPCDALGDPAASLDSQPKLRRSSPIGDPRALDEPVGAGGVRPPRDRAAAGVQEADAAHERQRLGMARRVARGGRLPALYVPGGVA